MGASSKPNFPGVIQGTLHILNSHWAFIVIAIIFRCALELGYWVYVNPFFNYAGFSWNPDIIKYIESWILYFSLTFFAPYRLYKPSDYFLVLLLLGLMAPLLSFYALADQSRQHLYTVILGYILVSIFREGRQIRIPVLTEGRLLSIIIVFFGAIGVSVWFAISGGIFYFNLDLKEVYSFRESVDKIINVGLMGYANIWAYKVFGPTLLALMLWRKAYWMALLVFGLHVYWFGVSAHRSVLFYPFLVVFIWFWFQKTRALSIVPLAMMAVIVAAVLIFLILDNELPVSLFVRRVFYVVANNTFDYYEFFSEKPLVLWSNSITSNFIDYPYDTNPADLIGNWRGTGAHVNNTFLSTGFMHAGIAGVVFYGMLTGLLFRLIDSLAASGIPTWVALSVLIVPSRSLLLSADLPTSLLTHGIGIGIVVLFLMRVSRRRSAKKYETHIAKNRSGSGEQANHYTPQS